MSGESIGTKPPAQDVAALPDALHRVTVDLGQVLSDIEKAGEAASHAQATSAAPAAQISRLQRLAATIRGVAQEAQSQRPGALPSSANPNNIIVSSPITRPGPPRADDAITKCGADLDRFDSECLDAIGRLRVVRRRAGRDGGQAWATVTRQLDLLIGLAEEADEWARELAARGDERATQWQRWQQDAMAELNLRLKDLLASASRLAASLPEVGLRFDDPAWERWTPPRSPVPLVRLGHLAASHSGLYGSQLELPSVANFPGRRGLAIQPAENQRDEARRLLQSLLFRTVAAIPPGAFALRFVDPYGLGSTFGPFLHLADYDQRLIPEGVSSDPVQIDRLLQSLEAHIALVTQRYLRGEYATIEAYNADAGETAERYQILIIADFPASFSDQAMERLARIAANGARCGVHVLMSGLPDGQCPSHRTDLMTAVLQPMDVLHLQGMDSYRWRYITTGFQFVPDSPPPLEMAKSDFSQGLFGRVIGTVGMLSRSLTAKAVTLENVYGLFSHLPLAPGGGHTSSQVPDPADPSTWWGGSSAGSVWVPVGRVGARGVCTLSFDSGNLSSALVIGAQGRGKTTLLHAAILGLAMTYSPGELEMYLLDSKQGVEFKVYERLPHARAVAIRNEREFGVSVLEGLAAELDRRGRLFKQQTGGGEVSLDGFRATTGTVLPRILLVADEFHELFEIDDSLGQRAAALLDDVIRQGRSYGIHVLLGSQTLRGMAALQPHTLQLVPQRIAFACSEDDAAIVLRDDNRAARDLDAPGEGIYNPARGIPEANIPFQGALAPPAERVALVARLAEQADRTGRRWWPIVFDGDDAHPLDEINPTDFAPEAIQGAVVLRLGGPCAVAGPVTALLQRRPGANVLVLHPDPQNRRGVLHAILESLLGARVRFAVANFSPDSDSSLDLLRDHGLHIVRRRQLGTTLEQLKQLVEERIALDDYRSPPEILLLNDLLGARPGDLANEDRCDWEQHGATSADLFQAILQDGPEVGVHVIALADSIATLRRRAGAAALRELTHRLTGRMSHEDSDDLYRSPAATQLRANQALYTSLDDNSIARVQLYRPAGPAWFGQLLADRISPKGP